MQINSFSHQSIEVLGSFVWKKDLGQSIIEDHKEENCLSLSSTADSTIVGSFPKEWVEDDAEYPSDSEDDTCLFVGTQQGALGPVSTFAAETIRTQLEFRAPVGIKFNRDKIVDELTGGACSAMSLSFIHSFFIEKENCLLTSAHSSEVLIGRIKQFDQKFSDCMPEMRDLQAAYNTIEIQEEFLKDVGYDHSHNKIQALVNYYSLVIDRSSPEFDVNVEGVETLAEIVNHLAEGVFLVRLLKPDLNEKLEAYGHSIVYIRNEGFSCLYDPNDGAKFLTDIEQETGLLEQFKKIAGLFETNKVRFYRLQSHDYNMSIKL